jgi:hypothetical protein
LLPPEAAAALLPLAALPQHDLEGLPNLMTWTLLLSLPPELQHYIIVLAVGPSLSQTAWQM